MGGPALITPRPASWLENAFWGRRQVASTGFGDLGYVALYRLYYEHRTHVAQLGRDYSLLRVSFNDAHHLRVDHMVPATAKRGGSETRAGVEVISVPLTGGGIVAQALRVSMRTRTTGRPGSRSLSRCCSSSSATRPVRW